MRTYFHDEQVQQLVSAADVIIFDMNGLIVDDEPLQLAAVNLVLVEYELNLTDHQWATQCVGRKPREFFTELLSNRNLSTEGLERICREKEEAYESLIKGQVKETVRAGFLAFFDYLRSEQKLIAVATSTSREGMELILGSQGINILRCLDFVICGDEVTRSKPDPMIYQKVKNHFGEQLDYLVFEDSEVGITSAKEAGLNCVAVPHKFSAHQDLTSADLKISDFFKSAESSV